MLSIRRDSLRTRIGLTALVVALVVSATAIWWWVRRDPEQDRPAVTVDLGSVGGAAEAEAAGVITSPKTGSSDRDWTIHTSGNKGNLPELWSQPTAYGPVLLSHADLEETSEEQASTAGTAVISVEPSTGEARWYRSLMPTIDLQDGYGNNFRFPQAHGLRASPDGEHIAVLLSPIPGGGSDRPGPRTVVVLSAKTGEVVRTVESRDHVLSMVLTDEALSVQTSPNLAAEGSTISTYSLSSPKAKPAHWSPKGWLVGSTGSTVMLSPRSDMTRNGDLCGEDACPVMTVSLADPVSGKQQRSIDGVYRVFPSGWVERFPDPARSSRIAPDSQEWFEERRELVDLASGSPIDITGLAVEPVITMTGFVWLLQTPSWWETSDGPNLNLTPSSWISAIPGGDRTQHKSAFKAITVDGNYTYSAVYREPQLMGSS
ncbi:hypothetical protein ACSL103130_01000 [Actinomyces slackii]|uniref:Uncharacterized protein n=1 Tax=Actinomyces slackii TaxID=52774 RepID=A0A3S4WJ67_9ACTO|nr:hypothetical protein [Actinomyces slackii]VEG74078.1 Uncharacterised protein [Actinomyces slackii]